MRAVPSVSVSVFWNRNPFCNPLEGKPKLSNLYRINSASLPISLAMPTAAHLPFLVIGGVNGSEEAVVDRQISGG
jgi:hypothetical protein